MEARLHASYKGDMFEKKAALFRDRPGRTGMGTAIGICALGVYFHDQKLNIERRAPTIRLNTVAMDKNVDDENAYTEDYIDAVPKDMGPLRRLFRALRSLRRVSSGDDYSQLFSFDAGELVNGDFEDNGSQLCGLALYVDPAKCRRLVFFGVLTDDEAEDLAADMRKPGFDWSPYSKCYAALRATAKDC